MPKPRGVGSPHYGGESGEIILALLNHSHHPASSICTGMEVRYFTNHSKVNFSFYLPSNFQKLKLQEDSFYARARAQAFECLAYLKQF